MAIIVNGDGILTGVSSLATALTDLTSGRGTVTGVATVGTLQLGAGVSMGSPRSQNAAIFTNNSEFLTVDDAGRVGVGTISPNTDAHPQNVGKINVGFITARSVAGDIDANTLVVAGISTFVGALNATLTGTASGNAVLTGSTNNQLVTVTGANAITGEANLTFDGNALSQTIDANDEGINITASGAHAIRLKYDSNPSSADDTIYFQSARWNGTEIASIHMRAGADTTNKDDGRITFHTTPSGGSNTERLRIDSSGRLLVGTQAARLMKGSNQYQALLVEGLADASSARISLVRNSNDDSYPEFLFGKSRGTADGAVTVVQNNDGIGALTFIGADGTDLYSRAAAIECYVDGTPGNDDMPARLQFSTTADGASAPTQRMRIAADGTTFFYHGGTNHITVSGQSLCNGVGAGPSPAAVCFAVGRDSGSARSAHFSGHLQFASGYGIDFSPSGNAGGVSSEVLNDYEEGVFTPHFEIETRGASDSPVDNVDATYVKVGKMVTCHYTITLNGTPSERTTGRAWEIHGFPFNSKNDISNGYISALQRVDNYDTGTYGPDGYFIFRLFNHNTYGRLEWIDHNHTGTRNASMMMTDNATVMGTITYQTDA